MQIFKFGSYDVTCTQAFVRHEILWRLTNTDLLSHFPIASCWLHNFLDCLAAAYLSLYGTRQRLPDAYCQSMTIVEESLSKLKETVCGRPIVHNMDLEPEKRKTIEHLEEMLIVIVFARVYKRQ